MHGGEKAPYNSWSQLSTEGHVCACAMTAGGLSPEREQQVREDEDYKNTSRQVAWSYRSVVFVSGLPQENHCQRMWKCVCPYILYDGLPG